MGNRNKQVLRIILRNKFSSCVAFIVILSIPYLAFWCYTNKPNAVLFDGIRNDKLLTMFESIANSSLNTKGQLSSILSSSSTDQNELEDSSNEPSDDHGQSENSKSFFTWPSLGEKETTDDGIGRCHPSKAMLRVFMYDLPPEFHFGLMDWQSDDGAVWPDLQATVPHYPGGLNAQHSIEYWLTLDLLSTTIPGWTGPCSAVRVENYMDADVVFVPFFSSLSYNRHSRPQWGKKFGENKVLQQKLVSFLTSREEWKRSGGQDHIVLAHHPNSMLESRLRLSSCVLILSDFGRYNPLVANVEKDVVAPYKHLIGTYYNDSAGYDDRPILLYFQGAIHRKDGGTVREQLYRLLRNEQNVHFSFGTASGNGVRAATQGMHTSKFCLNIAGDTPSSNRLFDAIASHCVPVIVSDEIELPYEDVLDYSEFCVIVRRADAVKKGFLINLVRGISPAVWTQMWQRLKEVEGHYEFQYPSKKDDAVQMIWQAVARKVPAIRLKVNRLRRYHRFKQPR